MAIHRLADGGGKNSTDPCRLYFDKRDYYYGQEVDFIAAPTPDHDSQGALQVEPGHSQEGEGPES
jgi:hypothetical protein